MSLSVRRAGGLIAALVLLRSAVWICWEQSHFDSDQAIFGLMATHLAEGRAFPVFMYGQSYMLSLEAWLAAPLFAAFGPSVFLLKLPLLLMNLVTALGLFYMLQRDAGLGTVDAFIASLFFAIAPPITASRLVEAAGGNIDPVFFTVLLWIVRGRPLVFGLVAGLAITNREFAWYAVVAALLVDAWAGTLFSRRRLREWATSAAAIAAILVAVKVAARYADVLGPGSAGASTGQLMGSGVSLSFLSAREVIENLKWFVSRNLPVLFGLWPQRLVTYNIASSLSVGSVPAAMAMLVLTVAGVVAAVSQTMRWVRSRRAGAPLSIALPRPWSFPVYLMLVAAEAAAAYVALGRGVRDLMLVRYTLLLLLGGVGVVALLLATGTSRALRWVVVGAMVTWAALSVTDHARVLTTYIHAAPPSRARQLIAYLDEHDMRIGRAPYWTAYLVDFLSHERITLASSRPIRITAYQKSVEAAGATAITIAPAGQCQSGRGTRVQDWCIERSSD